MLRTLSALRRALRHRLDMMRYNDFTIAEWFRAQGAQVGQDCRILVRSFGSEPYLIRIGNHVTISVNVELVTHDGAVWVFTQEHPSVQYFGPIRILDNCFIGAGAIILPGISVGPNSIVGAGSIVTRDVPPNTVVAGCPARKICDLEDYRKKVFAAWETQRPPGYMSELETGRRYAAATIHQQKIAGGGLLRAHLEKQFFTGS
jgi:acetyltransferase-like isoleucine patch superfamily enzyme